METEVQGKAPKTGRKNIIIVSLLVFILLLLAVSGQFVYALLKYDKIYSGVAINDMDAGGYTQDELQQRLKTKFEDRIKDFSIVLKTGSKEVKSTYTELEVSYDLKTADEKAYAVGRNGNLFSRLYEIFQANKSKKSIDMPIKFNEKNLESFIDKFYKETLIEKKQTGILVQDDRVTIRSGHHGESIDKSKVMAELKAALMTGNDITIKAELIISPAEKINTDDLLSQINVAPVDASFKVVKGSTTVIPHVMGRKVDKSVLLDAVAELDKQENSERVITVETQKPAITTEDAYAKLFKDTLGTMRSHFSTGNVNDKNRAENMKLAVAKINGYILAPGDIFSFNKIVGPRSDVAGYLIAHSYIAGKVVDSIGGGICQVSSTLYNAVLKSDFRVLERRNHTFTVGYVPKGQDATVSYSSTDFRFKNNTKWPVKVEGYLSKDNYIYFSIRGTNDNPGKEVIINSQVIKTIPFAVKFINDPTLAEGKTSIKQAGKNGYVVDTFKTIKQDGTVVSQTKLHRSSYIPLVQEIIKGTRKTAAVTPKEVVTAAPTAAPTPTAIPEEKGVDDTENPPSPEVQ